MADLDLSALASGLAVAKALLQHVPEPIALLAAPGTVAYANSAGREWFAQAGSAGPLAAGDVYIDRLSSLDQGQVHVRGAQQERGANPSLAAVREGLAAVLRGEAVSFTHEYHYRSASEEHWLCISAAACQMGGGAGAIVWMRDITAQRQQELAQIAELERLSLFNSLTSESLALSENGNIIDCNDNLCRLVGFSREELVGQPAYQIVAPSDRERVRENMLKNSDAPYEHLCTHKDGTVFEVAISGRKLMYQGRPIRGTSLRDLSLLKKTERALNAEREEKLQAQAALLAELSTPMIPLNDQVLVMPLIGSIDSQRARQILESLLIGIEQRRARTVIIDITGVRLVDSHVASTLMQAARATRLLGAQVVLTGIRAEVAQTLVRLGSNLDDLTTKSTLQSGIAFAITRSA